MKTAGDKAGVQATREGKGPAAGSRLRFFGSCRGRTRTEEGGFRGCQEGWQARKWRDKERGGGFPGGGRAGQGGSGGKERIAS